MMDENQAIVSEKIKIKYQKNLDYLKFLQLCPIRFSVQGGKLQFLLSKNFQQLENCGLYLDGRNQSSRIAAELVEIVKEFVN